MGNISSIQTGNDTRINTDRFEIIIKGAEIIVYRKKFLKSVEIFNSEKEKIMVKKCCCCGALISSKTYGNIHGEGYRFCNSDCKETFFKTQYPNSHVAKIDIVSYKVGENEYKNE